MNFCTRKLTTEAEASFMPPYNMPANTPTTVAVPQLTVPSNFEVLCAQSAKSKYLITYGDRLSLINTTWTVFGLLRSEGYMMLSEPIQCECELINTGLVLNKNNLNHCLKKQVLGSRKDIQQNK